MKKFEFILYINGNIVVQRYFSVRDFNKNSLHSIEAKECVDNCVYMIEDNLKSKTFDYLYKSYNPWKQQLPEDIISENIYDEEDVFDFEIKTDDKIVAKKRFTGNVYPQRIRYSVDIRKIIPSLIKEIQETFSGENFTVEYCGISL